MKPLTFLLASLLLAAGAIAQQVPSFPEGADKLNNKLLSSVNSRHINWAKAEAKKMNSGQLPATEATSVAQAYGKPGNMNDGDVEALAFIVLMQAAKSAQEDIKGVMASVKAINATKAKMRETKEARQKLAADKDIARLEQTESSPSLGAADIGEETGGTRAGNNKLSKKALDSLYRTIGFKSRITQFNVRTRKDLDTQIAQIQKDMDGLSEMSETQSLRLQMAMDRMSKMMNTLSNLQKKISSSADSIINNLK